MNWSAIGAIGELVGAVAVVVSILYLARSVSDNGAHQRRRANHELLDSTNLLFFALGENPAVASVWLRGMADFTALEPTERVMLSALLLNMCYTWEEAFYAAKGGQVDAFAFERMRATQSELLALPGFQMWWSVRREWLSPEFRQFMDDQVAAQKARVTPMYSTGEKDPIKSGEAVASGQ